MPEPVLLLSGIQHFVFCRRQWALIHMEGCRAENHLTASGRMVHRVAHEPFSEGKGHMVRVYDLAVSSEAYGMEGPGTSAHGNREVEQEIVRSGGHFQPRSAVETFGSNRGHIVQGAMSPV